jgi:SAM-dependent methyltransferase
MSQVHLDKAKRPDETLAAGSPDRFGYEWHNYSELFPEYEAQFRGWTALLQPEDWRGLTFLDVGCGMGRNSYWPMTYGAAGGLAVDVDERSLAAARRTLEAFPAVRVERRSAYDLDARDEFDLVYSIGVVHHLEDPARALANMVTAAKPGGRVLIWVYGRENNRWIVALLDPLRKALFARLPVGLVHHLALYPASILWLLLRLGFARIAYFRLVRQFTFPHLRAMVFDQMLPKIAHYWPRATVEQMLSRQGLRDVRLAWVNEVSWCAMGTKPARSSP